MRRLLASNPMLILLAVLVGCTLPEPRLPEPVTPPPASASEVEVLRQEVLALRARVDTLESQAQGLLPLASRVQVLEALLGPPGAPNKRKAAAARAPVKDATPLQVISEGQREARVEPSMRGYWGKSAEYVYTYAPGRVFTVYLGLGTKTGLFLPPGDRLVTGLYLNPDLFDVETERAGSDQMAYDVISIRPRDASETTTSALGEYTGFLVTEGGRRYLLRLVVGRVAMIAVTFEAPAITQAPAEPHLILPRPQS